MKRVYETSRDILIVLVVTFLLMLAAQILPYIFGFLGISYQFLSSTNVGMLLTLWSEIVGVLLIIWIYRRNRQIVALDFRDWHHYLNGIWGGLGLFALVWLISVFLKGFTISWVFKPSSIGIIILLFGGFLIQSFFEELLCRGYVMGYFLSKDRTVLAVILNSLIFAALHMANPGVNWLAGVNLIMFALSMSFVRLIWDNLLINGAIHGAWNFAEGVLFGTSVYGTQNVAGLFQSHETGVSTLINGGTFGLEASLICFVVYAVFLGWLVNKYRNMNRHVGLRFY
ncbi:CAAX protease family protein [Lentilactobacillus curieae]|uniref:CAAX protease family protein n=1 Tax=Lentilactobacillus curieae TaxID=1138822 RepID=A0A1S6QGL7_9LACO|nr:type II CAAX endopeptidase family protein [Lentilactobacillus curieae]AQW20766.1 CAAX protease family protein [Lentilactobacillus curieae]